MYIRGSLTFVFSGGQATGLPAVIWRRTTMRPSFEPGRGRSLGAVLAATVLGLAACGPGGGAAPTAGTSAGASPSAAGSAALSGPLRVDFLAYDAKMQPWLDEIKAEWATLHPDVELTLELPNLDTYRDSLTTQAQGGNPPDVAQIATSWMPALADAGVLGDWEESGFSSSLLDQMEPVLRDGARYQDKLVGLSYGSSARAVFYNEDVWSAAGATPAPETWDAFLAELRKIKAAGTETPFYYEGKGQEGMAAWFPYVYFSFGGELADAEGDLSIDREACISGLTIYDTMNKEGLFEPNVTAGDFTGQRSAMTSGEAGATITGPWLIGMYAEDDPDTKFGTFQIPSGTTEATVGVTDVYVTFTESQNPDAGRAFVEYLMDPDRNLRFIRDRGFLPVYTSQFSLPEFQEGPMKAFTDALPNAKFVPLHADWVQFDKIGTNAVTEMLLESSGAEQACQTMIDGLAGLRS
jgi:multiple sugar transport system substrate-binding protein